MKNGTRIPLSLEHCELLTRGLNRALECAGHLQRKVETSDLLRALLALDVAYEQMRLAGIEVGALQQDLNELVLGDGRGTNDHPEFDEHVFALLSFAAGLAWRDRRAETKIDDLLNALKLALDKGWFADDRALLLLSRHWPRQQQPDPVETKIDAGNGQLAAIRRDLEELKTLVNFIAQTASPEPPPVKTPPPVGNSSRRFMHALVAAALLVVIGASAAIAFWR